MQTLSMLCTMLLQTGGWTPLAEAEGRAPPWAVLPRLRFGLLNLLAEAEGVTVNSGHLGQSLLAAVIFSTVGIVVLFFCIWIFDKLTPYSFRKEILEDQNVALGIIVGAVLIGMAIIIAAAIHG